MPNKNESKRLAAYFESLNDDQRMIIRLRLRIRSIENPETGCIQTTYAKYNGYGRMDMDGHTVSVHQVAWVLENGPYPEESHINHTCSEPSCFNLDHLEILTPAEHIAKTERTISKVRAATTHCPSGHEYSPENTYICPLGRRRCRSCMRVSNRAYNERNKEAIRERKNAEYHRNKEAINEKRRAYNKRNREASRERNRAYYLRNKEELREKNNARQREYYLRTKEENRERKNAYQREYYLRNKEEMREKTAARQRKYRLKLKSKEQNAT